MTTRARSAVVLIYGSCVSRDTFDYLPASRFTLHRYVARQSLISAYADPSNAPSLALESTFQERVVREDFASSLPQVLLAAAGVDVVLWDLTDERLGVYALPDGSFVTRSLELIRSGQDRPLARRADHVPFGSPRHLELWTAALDRFVADLTTLGLMERLLLLDVPWARFTVSGAPTPASEGTTAEDANLLRRPYVERAKERGVAVVSVPEASVRAADEHKWGPAPFHYDVPVYEYLARRIAEHAGQAVPAPAPHPHGWDTLVDPWVDALPLHEDKLPSAYRIWKSARRYLLAGDVERARLCEQLIKILHNSYVPAELEMGEDTEFGYGGMGVIIHKACEIGRGVVIGSGVTLGGNRSPSRIGRDGRPTKVPRIEDYAYIASGAKILGGVTIGPLAIVGANAVVTHDVPPGGIVTGNPGRLVGHVKPENALSYKVTYLPLRRLDEAAFAELARRYLGEEATAADGGGPPCAPENPECP